MKKLSASVHQIEYFDRIISQIIADLEAVTLIVFPEPTIANAHSLNSSSSPSSLSSKLISDKALAAKALDYVEGGMERKSSLRKQTSSVVAAVGATNSSLSPALVVVVGTGTSPSSGSRKSSKRDSRAVIIVEPDVIVSCDEYFAALDGARSHRMADLQRRYESIGPLLIKLESLVLGTATGGSFKMRLFYEQLEGATYAGLLRLVRNNLNAFIRALDGGDDDDNDGPLFQVDAQLMLPEIILRPTANEIYEIIFQSVKDFLDRIAALKRWQPGSCIYYEDTPAEKQKKKKKHGTNGDLPNFIEDIVGDETVAQLLIKIQTKVQCLVQEAKAYLIG